MKLTILIFVLASIVSSQTLTNDICDDDNENLRCCFLNAPKTLSHIISIADAKEAGERLNVKGVVRKSDGKTPFAGVVMYAYHTNEKGIYPKRGNEVGIHKWHGYLHSWGKSNQRGEFDIRSIRPAQYPSRTIPAHIHLVVQEPNGRIYYVDDIMFDDDPLVENKKQEGVISITKNSSGVWEGFRTIRLR